MKKIIFAIAALSVFSASIPAFAMGHQAHDMAGMNCENCAKAMDCGQGTQTIQQQISSLTSRIQNGSKTLSAEELNQLNGQLQEAKAIQASLEQN